MYTNNDIRIAIYYYNLMCSSITLHIYLGCSKSFDNLFVIFILQTFFCSFVYFMKALKSSFLTVCKSFDCNEKFSYKIILKKSRFLKIKKMKKNSYRSIFRSLKLKQTQWRSLKRPLNSCSVFFAIF